MLKTFLSIFIFFFAATVFGQSKNFTSKSTEQISQLINSGLITEAVYKIDEALKVSPNSSELYLIRARANKTRNEYKKAYQDYKTSFRLSNNDNQIGSEFAIFRAQWFTKLDNKIKGYLREINVNPTLTKNYFQLCQIYFQKEDYKNSIKWLQKFISYKDTLSVDEVLYSSQVYERNRKFILGINFLKRYTDIYPKEKNIWSNYGYYGLWLSRFKLSHNAFEKSLQIDPTFRQAIIGLKLVDEQRRRQSHYAKNIFPIDRILQKLKKNPKDTKLNKRLIDEYVKYFRFEEAVLQIEFLKKSYPDSVSFRTLMNQVTVKRDDYYNSQIKSLSKKVLAKYNEKETLKILDYFILLKKYNSAAEFINSLEVKNVHLSDKALYQKVLINKELGNYKEAIVDLSKLSPDNEFGDSIFLLKAEILTWSDSNLTEAENILKSYSNSKMKNSKVYIILCYNLIKQQKFDEANNILNLDILKRNSREIEQLREHFFREQHIFNQASLLASAREDLVEGDCPEALRKFKLYVDNYPEEGGQIELAQAYYCNEQFDSALVIYKSILTQPQVNSSVYYSTANTLFKLKQYKEAAKILYNIYKKDSLNIGYAFALADAYQLDGQNNSARKIYYEMLDENPDSLTKQKIDIRIKNIPVDNFEAFLETFPTSVSIMPSTNFYSDNINFSLMNIGSRILLNATSAINFGADFNSYYLSNSNTKNRITLFSGLLDLKLNSRIRASYSLGKIRSQSEYSKIYHNINVEFIPRKNITISSSLSITDGSLILYSPYIISEDYNIKLFQIHGNFKHKNGLILSGSYKYYDINSGQYNSNRAFSLDLKVGKYFSPQTVFGYEYEILDYKNNTSKYYSPANQEAHSIWLNWVVEKTGKSNFILSPKLGYIPTDDYFIRQIEGTYKYNLLEDFILSIVLNVGSSYKFYTGYNYFSGYLNVYWDIY